MDSSIRSICDNLLINTIKEECYSEIKNLCGRTLDVATGDNGPVMLGVVKNLLWSLSLTVDDHSLLIGIIDRAYKAGIKTRNDDNSGFHSNGNLLRLYSYLDNDCAYHASAELLGAVRLLNLIIDYYFIIKITLQEDGTEVEKETPQIVKLLKQKFSQDPEFLDHIARLNGEALNEARADFIEALTSDKFSNAINNFCDRVGSTSSAHFKDKVKEIIDNELAQREGE